MKGYNFKLLSSSIILLVIFFLVSCQKEKSSNQDGAKAKSETSTIDNKKQKIVQNLLDDERFFSEATALGIERSSNPDLKIFSENATKLHSENFANIKSICEKQGLKIPEKLPKDLNDQLYKLTISNNADFDNFYYQTLSNDYKIKLDSLAKYVNENPDANANEILIQVSSTYTKNLEKLDKIK